MITIGSVCSGIGGLELGIEAALWEAGIECRVAWQVEIDPYCRAVLAKHWPEADRSVTDAKRLEAACADGRLCAVYIVCAGYPCQPFSTAGKRGGTEDPRHIWPHLVPAVRLLRPAYGVFENVAGHLSLGFDVVLSDIAALGYDAEWETVRASEVGAPHLRERLFALAYTDGGRLERERVRGLSGDSDAACGHDTDGCDGARTVGTGREGRGDDAAGLQRSTSASGRIEETQSSVGRVSNGLSHRLYLPDRWPAPPHAPQEEWEPPRTVTVREPFRRPRLRALGNAVVSQVARDFARRRLVPRILGGM